jgi:uncharacterized RDD family membrane protein YckC
MTENHYERLGVEPDASKEEIRSAYRDRLEELRTKIEKGRSDQARDGARAETAQVNAAWQVLSDPFQRQRYDAGLDNGAGAPDDDEAEDDAAAPAPARRRRLFEPRERVNQGEGEPRARGQRREPVGVAGAEAAPVGRRLAALGIDIAVMGALYVGSTSLLLAVASDSVAFVIVVVTALFALFAGYFVLPTARTGQTLGKRLTHIMVVDADTGTLPTWRRASMRYLVPIVLVIGLPVGTLGPMIALLFGISWLLIDTRIGLMDRLGHTRVVLARYRPGPPQ